MSNKTDKILDFNHDIYTELSLPKPVLTGIVSKITDRKGNRSLNPENNRYEYHLKNEMVELYGHTKFTHYTKGLYWVMDIFHNEDGQLQWNHYLVVIDGEDTFYPVYEYLNARDSTWIKDAIPYVKAYFDGEKLQKIKVTKYTKKKKEKTKWKI